MASVSAQPASIPRSVFYDLVKELVRDQTVERESEYPNRVSGSAVKLLQRTTEDYIAKIFASTSTPDNKILNVDCFKTARSEFDRVEEEGRMSVPEGQKTILTYDDDSDTLFE